MIDIIALFGVQNGRTFFVINVRDGIANRLPANEAAKEIGRLLGGGGGGTKTHAEGGGILANNVKEAIELLEKLVKTKST